MTDADSVIAAIEARRPGLKFAKQYMLMFFMQGHHVAHFGRPLFDEPIITTPTGVIVGGVLHEGDTQPTDEGELNTIGYVLERYGSLPPVDLRTLISVSHPFRAAAEGEVVALDRLAAWFNREAETDDPDDERPNRAERGQMNARWAAR